MPNKYPDSDDRRFLYELDAIISNANDGHFKETPQTDGQIMFIDTGIQFDAYFCDSDRSFSFGHISDDAKRAHEAVWDATQAGINAARPATRTFAPPA